MATYREKRLARAIEALSARDMQRFVRRITANLALSDSTKLALTSRLLDFAESSLVADAPMPCSVRAA